MIWVIDASIAVKWFLKDQVNINADAVLHRVIDQPEHFAVPELFAFEVYSVLCRMHPRGYNVFVSGVIPLLYGGIFRQPMTESLANSATHFVKRGLTGYDACYAALAKDLKGMWLTFDEKAHNCIENENISHVIKDGLPKRW
jgi:predicted nucleic acid-binding protein